MDPVSRIGKPGGPPADWKERGDRKIEAALERLQQPGAMEKAVRDFEEKQRKGLIA